jgi:sugar/nucleoside kinase (ribokinase family)
MMASDDSPQYLIIGHLSLDQTDRSQRLGGTAAYASLTAAALGLRVGLVTACPAEVTHQLPRKIMIERVDSAQPTVFVNRYESGHRHQVLLTRAGDLDLDHVPPSWRRPDMVHLAPIADEVDPRLAGAFPNSQVTLTFQGWLRRWDSLGHVERRDWDEIDGMLPAAQIAIVSDEDVEAEETWIARLAARYEFLVVTRAAAGVTIYREGVAELFPAPLASELDPTGAGDIFAAAFQFHYHQHREIERAAQFANQLASRSVEREGLEGCPTLAEVRAAHEQALA